MDIALLRHQAVMVFMFREQARDELVKIIFLCLHNRKLIQFQMRYLVLHKLSISANHQPKMEIRPTYTISSGQSFLLTNLNNLTSRIFVAQFGVLHE